jgi:hypothetical protein
MTSRWWTFHRNSSAPTLDKNKRIEVQKWTETVADVSKKGHREQEQPAEAKQRRTPHDAGSADIYRHSDYLGSHRDRPQQSRPSRPKSSVNLSSSGSNSNTEKPKSKRKHPINPLELGHRSTPSFEIQPDFRTAPLHLRKDMFENEQANQTQQQPQHQPNFAELLLVPSASPTDTITVPRLPDMARINSAPSSAGYDRSAFREAETTKKGTSTPVAGRSRGASVTSGSSAYTAFIDGTPSSPSSYDHTVPWPPLSTVPSARRPSTTPESKSSRPLPLTGSPASSSLPLSPPLPFTRVRASSQNMVSALAPFTIPAGAMAAYPSPRTSTTAQFSGMSSPPPTSAQPYSGHPVHLSHRSNESSDSSNGAHVRASSEAMRAYPRTNNTPMTTLSPPPRRQTKKPTPVSHACLSL